MQLQKTIGKAVSLEGVGIHSGKKSHVLLTPASLNTGIVFKPANPKSSTGIVARVDNLVCTRNAITIGRDGYSIQTIEHFMAVFYVLGITNLYVIVDGEELPILDGSSIKILEAVKEAGIVFQEDYSEAFSIPYPIWIEEDGKYLIALPGDGFRITYTIDFSSKSRAIGTQTAHFNVTPEIFEESIAPARTFGFFEDMDDLRSNNLGLGGSLENALIYTRDELLNPNLRFANECVRHKILDLIGDLSLVGFQLRGYFIAHKSGHSMDMEMVKRIRRIASRSKRYKVLPRELVKRKEREFLRFRKKINL